MTHKGFHAGMASQTDFDFRQHLRDTIILLGGKEAIADMLIKSQDGFIDECDVAALRNYNSILLTESKTRLSALKRLKVRLPSS
ncbi:MAG TPA: hypothetical protein VGO67_09680 [Verrucomicrobiae bacterium]|jgi:hypothetical protein